MTACQVLIARMFNTCNAAGMSRRQYQNVTNLVTNVNIIEFRYHIWNRYKKCIQKSTNMPSFGSVICEIAFEFKQNVEKIKHIFCMIIPMTEG